MYGLIIICIYYAMFVNKCVLCIYLFNNIINCYKTKYINSNVSIYLISSAIKILLSFRCLYCIFNIILLSISSFQSVIDTI